MEEKTINFGEKLADYISEMEYGTVIQYQEIESILHERRGSQRYYRFISKAKGILEERGKMIKPIGKGSYQILYPGDYSTAYAREVRIAKNHVKHGGKIIKSAPVNDMSIDERKQLNDVSDFHARLEAQVYGNYVEVRRLVRKRKNPLLQAQEA